MLLGRIVNGADTDNTLYHQAKGPGLQAIAEGYRHLDYKHDHALNAAEWIVYDARETGTAVICPTGQILFCAAMPNDVV